MNWHKHIERKLNIIITIKKDRTQKTELRKQWKRTGVVIYSRELTRKNRSTERVQTRPRWSTEINRERIEETIKERGTKITGIS